MACSKQNVFFTLTGNYPSHTHATIHPHTHSQIQEHLCNACRAVHAYDSMYICSYSHTGMDRIRFFFSMLCSRTTLTDMSADTSRHVEMDTNTKILYMIRCGYETFSCAFRSSTLEWYLKESVATVT